MGKKSIVEAKPHSLKVVYSMLKDQAHGLALQPSSSENLL